MIVKIEIILFIFNIICNYHLNLKGFIFLEKINKKTFPNSV